MNRQLVEHYKARARFDLPYALLNLQEHMKRLDESYMKWLNGEIPWTKYRQLREYVGFLIRRDSDRAEKLIRALIGLKIPFTTPLWKDGQFSLTNLGEGLRNRSGVAVDSFGNAIPYMRSYAL